MGCATSSGCDICRRDSSLNQSASTKLRTTECSAKHSRNGAYDLQSMRWDWCDASIGSKPCEKPAGQSCGALAYSLLKRTLGTYQCEVRNEISKTVINPLPPVYSSRIFLRSPCYRQSASVVQFLEVGGAIRLGF